MVRMLELKLNDYVLANCYYVTSVVSLTASFGNSGEHCGSVPTYLKGHLNDWRNKSLKRNHEALRINNSKFAISSYFANLCVRPTS